MRRLEHNVAPMPMNASGKRRHQAMPWHKGVLWYVVPSLLVAWIGWMDVETWGRDRVSHSVLMSASYLGLGLICVARGWAATTATWVRWLAIAPILAYFVRAIGYAFGW